MPVIAPSWISGVAMTHNNDRDVTFTILTDAVYRNGVNISSAEWKLDNFFKNPVVLWANDYSRPPIGRAKSVEKSGRDWIVVVEFGTHPFDDWVLLAARERGVIEATVSFILIKSWSNEQSGEVDVQELEVLAVSLSGRPANRTY